MVKKVNKETLRVLNSQIILNYINKYKEISRTDLALHTKLSATTISTIISELIEKKMVVELRVGESSGGRKPLVYGLNSSGAYALCMRLTPRGALYTLLDLKCQVVFENEIKKKIAGEKQIEETIKSCIEDIKKEKPETIDKICGIGVSIPGIIDYKNGKILYSSNLDVKDFNIEEVIRKYLDKKTYLFKDTDALILGEHNFGVGKLCKDLVYILVENGVGMAYINSGKLFKLPYGGLELGHVSIYSGGTVCKCGSRGCLGTEVSEIPAINRIKELINMGFKSDIKYFDNLLYKDIVEYSNNGDMAARKVLDEQAEMLGVAVGNVINLFNPEMVIIGGPLYNCKWDFVGKLSSVARNRALIPFSSKVKIEMSKLGNYSSIMGMGNEVFINEIFAPVII